MATADKVVVELEARVDGFQAKVRGAANDYDRSMSTVERSSNRAERAVAQNAQKIADSTARIANAQRNLGRQISDVGSQLATGTNPLTILAQQAPQVADAITDMGGRAAKFAAFLSGPWGAALLAAGSVLALIATRGGEASDSLDDLVDKLRDNADKANLAERASAIFSTTLEGVEEAARDAEKAMAALAGKSETAAQSALRSADGALANVRALRAETLAAIELAQTLLDLQVARSRAGGDRSDVAALGLGQAFSNVEAARARLGRVDELITRLEKARTTFSSYVEVERASLSVEEQINQKYDQRLEAQRKLRAAGVLTERGLRDQVRAINAAREAELKRESDSKRRTRENNNEIGRTVSLSEARGIVEGIGGRVTSAQRSRAQQEALYARYQAGKGPLAAKPGSSLHEAGQALDIAKTAGITLAKIRAAFQKRGVQILELLDEGSHYHVGFGSRGTANAAAKAETRAEREFQDALDDMLLSVARQLNAFSVNVKDEPLLFPGRQSDGSIRGNTDQALQIIDAEKQARFEAADEVAQKRLDDERELASVFTDLFTSGFDSVADRFKQQMLAIVAQIVAKLVIAQFDGQPGGGNIGQIIGSVLGASGFANGGAMRIGGRGGTDQNVLSLNGRPLARVSRGETLNVVPARAKSAGGPMVVSSPQFDLRGAVVTAELYADMERISRQSAAQAGTAAYRQSMRDAPAAIQRARRYGTPAG